MSLREARVCGVPARLMRVSFTGELGYEINVPSHFGRTVWEAVWREVQKRDGCAYGTEAMHVMRAEKGYVIVGQETDWKNTPSGDQGFLADQSERRRKISSASDRSRALICSSTIASSSSGF